MHHPLVRPEVAFVSDPWSERLDFAAAVGAGLPPPHAELASCVVVPARDEVALVPRLLAALAGQLGLDRRPLAPRSFEVILLANNCTDQTAAVARALGSDYAGLTLHIIDLSFIPPDAHVGRARQVLFDLSFTRFQHLYRPDGVILSTDADSRPAADWIAQTLQEMAAGSGGVGGRILLELNEQRGLSPAVRRLFLLDIGYRRALEELRWLYAPEHHDPFPRHHQHFGASLAVTASAYRRAGGMPLVRTSEDVALYRAIVESGARFRHSDRVRVFTSARVDGRAEGGLADAIAWWQTTTGYGEPVLVESAGAAAIRLQRLGRWCRDWPSVVPPAVLTTTPRAAAGDVTEIQQTLRDLRRQIEALRPLTLTARLGADLSVRRVRSRREVLSAAAPLREAQPA